MDYEQLENHLRGLFDGYRRANSAGRDLADTIARASTVAAPATIAMRRLSEAVELFKGGGTKGVEAIHERMIELQGEERRAAVLVRNLQRRAAEIDRQRDVAAARENVIRKQVTALEAQSDLTKTQVQKLVVLKAQLRNVSEQTATFLTSTLSKANRLDTQIAKTVQASAAARAEFTRTAREVLSVSRALSVASKTAASALEVSGLAYAVKQSLAFNRTLIEANSTLGVRERLLGSALTAQMRTGDSLEEIADLMREVRAQTQLYDTDLADVLTTASKLHQGLGATNAQIAVLLNTSRQLHTSFADIADTVTTIVDSTSLSVGDAVDVVRELRDVLASYNVQGRNLQDAARYVSALEQSLRSVGADAGLAVKLVSNFSDMRRKGGLGLAFGSGGPDFASDPRRVAEVTKNVAAFLRQFRDNAWVFPQMAESFGLTAREAQNLIDAQTVVGRTEQQLATQRKTLDQRFREQAAASGQVYGQLVNNLKALLLDGLVPVTWAVARLNQVIVKAREIAGQVPSWVRFVAQVTLATAAVVTIGLAITRAVAAIRLVRGALEAVATGRTIAGAGLGRQVATDLAGETLRRQIIPVGGGVARAAPTLFRTLTRNRTIGGTIEATRRGLVDSAAGAAIGKAITGVGARLVSLARVQNMSMREIAGAVGNGLTALAARLSFRLAPTAGILPFILANIVPIIGVAAPIVATYAIGRWYQKQKEAQNEGIIEEMRRIRGTTSERLREAVGQRARQTLSTSNGSDAAAQFMRQAAQERKSMLSSFKNGLRDGEGGGIRLDAMLKSQEELRNRLRQRVDVQEASIAREYRTAPAERRDELDKGLRDLLDAVRDLVKLQAADTAAAKKIADDQRREAQRAQEAETRNSTVKDITKSVLFNKRGEVY